MRFVPDAAAQDTRELDALIDRAYANLFADPANPDAADADIERALDIDEESPAARELDLWMDYRYGSSFLLAFRTADRLRRARRIIERDSTSRIAHLVAGLIYYSDFRDTYRSVDFGSFTSPGRGVGMDDDIVDAAVYLFDANLVENGDETGLEFRDPRHTGRKIDFTPGTDAERKDAGSAIRHLEAAVGADAPGWIAGRYLAEILVRSSQAQAGIETAARIVAAFPDRPEGYFYRGMFRELKGDYAAASADFDAAFARSDGEMVDAMTSPERFRGENDRLPEGTDDEAWWTRSDPQWSTPENEALVEHVARMVRADLMYGVPEKGVRGWETDPGEVVIRYGPPRMTARFHSLTEGYLLMHYGDRKFVFMTPARRGGYTFYSPSAADLTGPRNVIREWQSDFEIASREAFREEPRRSSVLEDRLDLAAEPTLFPGPSADQSTIAVAFCSRAESDPDHASLYVLPSPGAVPVFAAGTGRSAGHAVSDADCPARVLTADVASTAQLASLEVRAGDRRGVKRFVPGASGARAVPGTGAAKPGMIMSGLMPALLVEERASGVDTNTPNGVWVRNGYEIHPTATARLPRGDDLYLYFEAYDLPSSSDGGATIGIQAALVPDDDPGKLERLLGRVFGRREVAPVSVDFQERLDSRTMYRYLVLGTTDLDPGVYAVAVRLTDPTTGTGVEARRTIEITEPR
jgi:GWxTD domain-containing protein